MGLGKKNANVNIKNAGNNDDPPPPPGGGGPQARQKLRVGESAGSAAAVSGGNMISSPLPTPTKPAAKGSVLSRIAKADAGEVMARGARAAVTLGLTEAPAILRAGKTVLDYAKTKK